MLEGAADELLELRRRLEGRESLRRRLDATQLQLERERLRLDGLASDAFGELLDVKKLEGLSLTALVHTLLGDRDQQLDTERREYLSAKLSYDECRAGMAALEAEAARLRTELAEMEGAAERYERLLAEKEERLVRGGALGAGRIVELTRDLAGARAAIGQMLEAVAAGEEARGGLEGIASALRSAGNLGPLSTVARSWIASAARQSQIDEAAAEAPKVQQSLRRFQRELADVLGGFPTGFTLDVEALSEFSDGFFDSLMADWTGQPSGARCRQGVEEMLERVGATLAALEARVQEFQARAARLEGERRAAIERA